MDHFNHFIESYAHNGRIGVLVELDVSDSIAMKTDAFRGLAKDLAMHITAMAPTTVEELLLQPSVRNPAITVSELIAQVANELREQIAVIRFVRWTAYPQEPLQPDPPRSPAVIYNLRSAG